MAFFLEDLFFFGDHIGTKSGFSPSVLEFIKPEIRNP